MEEIKILKKKLKLAIKKNKELGDKIDAFCSDAAYYHPDDDLPY